MEKLEKFQILVSCLIITLGFLIAALIFASKISKDENITVTGSAYKIVKSDSAKLEFSIRTRKINQKEAFNNLKQLTPKVVEYLENKGFKKEDIDIKAMNGYSVYRQNEKGYSTNEVIAYDASQLIEIKSKNIILNLSTQKGTSINDLFYAMSNMYQYKKTPIYQNARKNDITKSILNNNLLLKIIEEYTFVDIKRMNRNEYLFCNN